MRAADAAERRGRGLVVLSVFDGVGVVWHALDDILTRHGLRHHLKGAFAVEMLPHLAAAVPKWWAERKRLGPALP
eukprot:3244719-Alexandrium_andersonii.AAC.1